MTFVAVTYGGILAQGLFCFPRFSMDLFRLDYYRSAEMVVTIQLNTTGEPAVDRGPTG